MFPMQLEICTPSCASRKVASEGDNLDGVHKNLKCRYSI